jgi:hypothetical protein
MKIIIRSLFMILGIAVFNCASGQNLALTATAAHSGGGATTYAASNYNDNIYNTCNALPWGWVSTNGWIEYTWASPQVINKVVFRKDNRPMTTCVVEYWNGTGYSTATNYSGSSCDDSVTFTPVTTTRLRFNNVAGSSNPNHREIQVYGITCSTKIDNQPSSVAICENKQAQFSITATDVTAYKWQVNEGSGFFDVVNGTNYSGATSNTLTVSNTPATFDNYSFRCLVSKGTSSACADTSDTVTLTVYGLVNATPLMANDSTCIGATKDITLQNIAGSVTGYRWQMYNAITQNFEDLVVQPPYMLMGGMLRIIGASDTLDGAKYRCIVNGVCDTFTSNETRLTVLTIPKVGVHPEDVNTEQGKNVVFEVQATGAAAKYRWQASAPNDKFSFINDGGIYSGVTTNRLSIKGVSRVQDGFQFRCEIRTASSCNAPGDTSNFAVLYVTPAASVSNIGDTEALLIFPNPAGNELFIRSTAALNNGNMKYKIIDRTGKTLTVGNLNVPETSVDLTALPANIYLLEIVDAAGHTIITSRFTKL